MTPVTVAIVVAISLPICYRAFQYLEWMYRTFFVIGRAVDKCPGDPTKWPYGNLHQMPGFNEKLFPFQVEMASKYNRLWRNWFGPFVPFMTLCHPDTIKPLVKSEAPKFTGRNAGYLLAEPWLGEGLLLSGGQKWKRNRRLLTPAFHFDILKSYVNVYNEETETLIQKWAEKSSKGQSFDIQSDICLCTLSIILRCAFSYNEKIQDAGEKHPYASAVLNMSRLMVERAFNPLVRMSNFLYGLTANGREFFKHCDYVHQVAETVISQRKRTLQADPDSIAHKKYLDFLDILLQAKDQDGTGLTDLEIRNEVDTFLFEGHDTTASGISWALYSLAKHPEYQKKAQEEVDQLLEGRPSKCLEWEDFNKLPYLTMCLKESMRVWCPVPVISRQLEEPLTIDGFTFPPHTLIDINMVALHHNPAVWGEDHATYDPDRFLHEKISKMDTFAFLPFSAGSRNCIGQNFAFNEMKTTIARIIQRFDLSVDESHPVFPRTEVVTRAINGIKLSFKPRT